MKKQTKTLKVRVKDKHTACLERMAFEVNQIWNAANEETSLCCWIPIPRDRNAAKNILRLGHQTLAGGIPFL